MSQIRDYALSKGIGGHHRGYRGRSDEWLTPPPILRPLGDFDLDPCAPVDRPWAIAKEHFTILDDGLSREWHGRVFLNPPYGPELKKWLCKMSRHHWGTALIFARTETEAFQKYVFESADALLFLRGRINFYFVDGTRASANAGGPSVLIAYGFKDAFALRDSGIAGHFVWLRGEQPNQKSGVAA